MIVKFQAHQTMYSNLAIVLGCTFAGILANPVDLGTEKQPEKRAVTYPQALAGCKVPEKNKYIFWSNSKTSKNSQDIADEFGDKYNLITMNEACEGVLELASAADFNTISKAFAQATVNAGSTIAYAVLPDTGASPKSLWIQYELPVLTKAKITLHKISLENPTKAVTKMKLGKRELSF